MKVQGGGKCARRESWRETDDAQGEPLGASYTHLPLHPLGKRAELLIERPEGSEESERFHGTRPGPGAEHPTSG